MSTNLSLPGPGGAEPEKIGNEQTSGEDHGERARRHHQHSQKRAIPSEADCLSAIAQVAGLAAMGLLKPGQANAVRNAYRDILMHHKAKAKEVEKSLSNSDVLDLLRTDPKLLDLLAPLLTGEQLDMVMNAGSEDADG